MNAPIKWLLEGEAYIRYRTLRDLAGQPEDAPEVQAARREMLNSQPVRALLTGLSDWPGPVIASHKSAGQPFHRLTFLADLGLRASDSGMQKVINAVLKHRSEEGPFNLPVTLSGDEKWAWALCDSPLTVYALAKFGLQDHPSVQAAVTHLTGLVRDNGWPCAVSKELGNWRGPGRKQDPCPFANLAMLKAVSVFDSLRNDPACHTGAETLLDLWTRSAEAHPYMFYMGTDFRKIKVPFVWYDLMHVLEVLTRFEWLHGDPRLLDMLSLLKSKADPQGCFTLESVWTAWKDWDFGQKKTPSRWLTLLAWRTLGRVA